MVDVEVRIRREGPWNSSANVYFRGGAFHDGEYVEDDFGRLFDGVGDPESFRERLDELNGQFAVVLDRGDAVYAAVDHVASVPLFYGLGSETVYVGDSPVWMKERLPAEACDEDAVTELLMVGYVTGRDTLFPRIKQLQAGQMLTVDRTGTDEPKPRHYFGFASEAVVERDREQLFEQFETVATDAFERLVERADGEPLLLALSGGYDSRLAALLLDQVGYENTYAFTFYPDFVTAGDLEIAADVAAELDFEWAPIELTADDFRGLATSGELDTLKRVTEDYATAKPLPLWSAVMKRLRDSPAFPDSGIVITGHNIAHATEHLPPRGEDLDRDGMPETVDWLLNHHYRMRHLSDVSIRESMRERVREWVSGTDRDGSSSAVDTVVRWYWQERAPKFLMRHPEEFGYWGYERAVPLWDRDVIQFWNSLPLEYQADKHLLEEFVDWWSGERIGPSCSVAGKNEESGASILSTLETVVSRVPFESAIRSVYRQLQTRNVRQSEEYARFSYIPPDRFERLYPRVQHEKYFHALDELSRVACSPPPGTPFADDLRLYEGG